MNKNRYVLNVLIVLVISVFLAGCSEKPPENGTHFACSYGTTMDISHDEEVDEISVTYTCREEETPFETKFTIPNDEALGDMIRKQFGITNVTTGVVLDENNNLIQLYQIADFGLVEYWHK